MQLHELETYQDTLPSVPSALIRLALSDLKKVEADKRYVVYMDHWHSILSNDRPCTVCLAGSVIAKTIGLDISEIIEPGSNLEEFMVMSLVYKLKALDCFRIGRVLRGLVIMNIPSEIRSNLPENLKLVDIATYRPYDNFFNRDMEKLASDLQEIGL